MKTADFYQQLREKTIVEHEQNERYAVMKFIEETVEPKLEAIAKDRLCSSTFDLPEWSAYQKTVICPILKQNGFIVSFTGDGKLKVKF